MIWQAVFMDGFYSPGKERLHALGAIDMALWDIKGKALNCRSISCSVVKLASTSSRHHGDVWPNERPGLGVSVDEKALTFVEQMTEGVAGVTHRRLDGPLTHW